MTHASCLTLASLLALGACSPTQTTPATGVEDGAGRASGQVTWVVVELFTSEGCSSCPPTDRIVRELSERGVDPDGRPQGVLALGFHVDYWDDLGWPDPFASPAFSQRQRDYDVIRERDGLFTPEAVVDGAISVGGSGWSSLTQIIDLAADRPRASLTARCDEGLVSVQVHELPPGSPEDRAELQLAITERGLRSHVRRGENAGQLLEHAPVVRKLTDPRPAALGVHEIEVDWNAHWKHENVSIVAFIQEVTSRRILGATPAECGHLGL